MKNFFSNEILVGIEWPSPQNDLQNFIDFFIKKNYFSSEFSPKKLFKKVTKFGIEQVPFSTFLNWGSWKVNMDRPCEIIVFLRRNGSILSFLLKFYFGSSKFFPKKRFLKNVEKIGIDQVSLNNFLNWGSLKVNIRYDDSVRKIPRNVLQNYFQETKNIVFFSK